MEWSMPRGAREISPPEEEEEEEKKEKELVGHQNLRLAGARAAAFSRRRWVAFQSK